MRQITAISVLGFALLCGLVASRLSGVTDSPAANHRDKAGSGKGSTLAAKEQLQEKESRHGKTNNAGGIWFW
jgi:hypothetical protein